MTPFTRIAALVFAVAVAVAVAARAADTRVCPKCKMPADAAWKFCPFDGTALPAGEAAPVVKAEPKNEPEFPGPYLIKGNTYTNKEFGFRIAMPNDEWTLIADAKKAHEL